MEEATSKLQRKLEELHLRQRQLVILPNNIHVPESEITKLSFGSFGADFGVTKSYVSGPMSDKSSTDKCLVKMWKYAFSIFKAILSVWISYFKNSCFEYKFQKMTTIFWRSYCHFSCDQCFYYYLKYVIKLNNYINNNNNNNVFVVEIHGEKFIKFKILKITHQ